MGRVHGQAGERPSTERPSPGALNILLTQTAYPPSLGGAQAHLHGLARELATRHRLRVATFWWNDRQNWLGGTTWRESGGPPYCLDGVLVKPLELMRWERWRMTPWIVAATLCRVVVAHRLARVLLPPLRRVAGDPDVVHHGRVGRLPLGLASLALARERGVPFVLTPYHHPRWDGWRGRAHRRLYREADAVLALTQAEADALARFGVTRTRIHVVGTGAVLGDRAEAEAFRVRHGLLGPIVLFLGRQVPYKGYGLLLAAARRVWAARPDVHFVFIGPRTRASRLRFAAERDPRVVELGPVDVDTKTSALAAATLLCVPSTEESFGAVYVEACLLGRPVIEADIPAVRDVIADGVDGLVSPARPADVADRILALLGDPARAARMGVAGWEKAIARYNWPALAARAEAAYRSVVVRPLAATRS